MYGVVALAAVVARKPMTLPPLQVAGAEKVADGPSAAAAGPSSAAGEIDDIFGDFAAKKKAATAAKQQSEKEAAAQKKHRNKSLFVEQNRDAFDSMMADTSGEGSGKKRKLNLAFPPSVVMVVLMGVRCVREIYRRGVPYLLGGGTQDQLTGEWRDHGVSFLMQMLLLMDGPGESFTDR